MSLQLHLTGLIGWLILSSLVATSLARWTEEQERDALQQSGRQMLKSESAHWMSLSHEGMRQFTEDYSWWDEMIEFTQSESPEWADRNLEGTLEFWALSGLWIFDQNGEEIYELASENHPELSFPLSGLELLQSVRIQPFTHFYRSSPEGWIELRGAPIQSDQDEDRSGSVHGWLFVGRLWDQTHFERMRPDDSFHLEIRGPTNGLRELPSSRQSVIHPLRDERGAVVAEFRVSRETPEINSWNDAGIDETVLWFSFTILNALVLGVWLKIAVARPIRNLTSALDRHDSAKIEEIARKKNELGEIAARIGADFHQQDLLREETERRRLTETALRRSETSLKSSLKERTQLQLDLHDSTIQTLYASGMSLAAIEKQLERGSPSASEAIPEIRRNLQLAVDDLRRFIADSAAKETTSSFDESIQDLLALMRSTNRVEIKSEIEEGADEYLKESQTIELLQILREGMSNSIRHANANTIWVKLMVRPHLVRLVVEDDGIGLSRHQKAEPLSGIKNMQSRAKSIGATLKFEDRTGGGTRIDLGFTRV